MINDYRKTNSQSLIRKSGLTLVELLIATILLTVLTGATAFVFISVIKSWSPQETRAAIHIKADRGIEEMVRTLRESKNIQSSNNEIRFTVAEGGSDNHYIFYLYSAADPYPPQFNQDSYEIRKASLISDINGGLVNAGKILITDVVPPPITDLSHSANITTLDLSVSVESEAIRTRTEIMPRNM